MGELLLFIGPPGVAKSKLISTLCELTGIRTPGKWSAEVSRNGGGDFLRDDDGYFEYLLTPFTEPNELFGALKIEDFGQSKDRIARHEQGMIHRSRVIFLDEVFNGSSAILNSLLALMNERVYHDRGEIKRARHQVLFAASNGRPSQPELLAAYDRFVFRTYIGFVEPSHTSLKDLLDKAWKMDSHAEVDGEFKDLFEKVRALQREFKVQREKLFYSDTKNIDGFKTLSYIVHHAKAISPGSFSNRRIVKLTEAMVYERLLRGQRELDIKDGRLELNEFELAWLFFLDDIGDNVTDPSTINQFEAVVRNYTGKRS